MKEENRKKLLILPEYWVPHVFALVRGFRDLAPDNVDVYWTNRKWSRDDFGIDERWESPAYLPVEHAMKALNEGFFDAVILSDGTNVGYLTTKLHKKTTRVMLDVTDHRYINEAYLYFADVYLKTQHPKGEPLIGGPVDLSSKKPPIPVVPWPYCCGGETDGLYNVLREERPAVQFRGWAWPQRRVSMVRAVADSGIPLEGGLYRRDDLPQQNCDFPKSLEAERLKLFEYISELGSCLVALNPVGNGEMCFRTMEIMRLGVAMVSQPIDVRWPARPPVNGEEWLVVESDEDAVEACRSLIDNPDLARRIGAAGRAYWEAYCTDLFAATRLMQVLGWEKKP